MIISDCDEADACGYSYLGGTYSITGDIISTSGGMTEDDGFNGRLEITNDILKLYDENTNEPKSTFIRIPECP